jgi:hypothetical protein
MILGTAAANDIYTGVLQPDFLRFLVEDLSHPFELPCAIVYRHFTQPEPNAIMVTNDKNIEPLPTPSRIKLTPPRGNKVIEEQLRSAGLLNEVNLVSDQGELRSSAILTVRLSLQQEVSRANFGAFYDAKQAEFKVSRCDFII